MVKAQVTGGTPHWTFAGLFNTVLTREHPSNNLIHPHAGGCNPANFLTSPGGVREAVLRERGSLNHTRNLYLRNFQFLCPVLPCRRKTRRKYHSQLKHLTFPSRDVEWAWIWVRIVKSRRNGLFRQEILIYFRYRSWTIIMIPTNQLRNNQDWKATEGEQNQ